MKTVVESGMVEHLWFHQAQDHARNKSGNFFFRDRNIYSYGEHFCIARVFYSPGGRKVVIFTTRTYSVTTSKHIAYVRQSIPAGTPIFHVGYPERIVGHKSVLQEYRLRIKEKRELFTISGMRRGSEKRLEALNYIIEEANLYCELFRLKTRFATNIDPAVARQIVDRYNKREKAAQERREKAQVARLLRLQADQAEGLAAWLRGETARLPYSYSDKVYLRIKTIRPGERIVETSLGAEFPLSHARTILAMVRRGQPYEHDGHTLHAGVFRVDKIDAEGNVTAGCHYVERAEIDRFALVLEKDRTVPVAKEIGLSEDTPLGIVADYLDESGQTERAEELRAGI